MHRSMLTNTLFIATVSRPAERRRVRWRTNRPHSPSTRTANGRSRHIRAPLRHPGAAAPSIAPASSSCAVEDETTTVSVVGYPECSAILHADFTESDGKYLPGPIDPTRHGAGTRVPVAGSVTRDNPPAACAATADLTASSRVASADSAIAGAAARDSPARVFEARVPGVPTAFSMRAATSGSVREPHDGAPTAFQLTVDPSNNAAVPSDSSQDAPARTTEDSFLKTAPEE